ncbi:glycosyltransferase family 4 protein [Pajaroellobacter abortibovis]|uniref:Glycosyl transferase family 1 n=1 Tax=Pajaroellobacter abortibovis TaxID=1882918 RepID=A0A1L6MVU9_9BACT|nr:glycosyltransferase family 4 protein [Pajaroellobacter abortibovis]APR99604.1 hypothetical protein BCY86_02100 [Pajaroellobacter abortibovis]
MLTPQKKTYRLTHIFTVSSSLIFIKNQIQFIKEKGFEISIIAAIQDDKIENFCQEEGVHFYTLPIRRAITPKQDLFILKQLTQILHQIQPHVVHAHTPKGGLLGMLGATVAKVPIRFYHMRGLPFTTASKSKHYLLKNTEKISCKLAHQVLCQSHSLRNFVIYENICSAQKTTVLCEGSNGIDFENRFNPRRFSKSTCFELKKDMNIPYSSQVIGYVGRITCDKGIPELQESWNLIKKKNQNVYLVIIGSLDEREKNENLYSNFCNDPQVRLIPHTDIPEQYYAIFDLFVLPSYREGFPNVLNEAAAMQLPIVTSNAIGCTDAVEHEVTGTVVPIGDTISLTQAIEKYLNNHNLRREHGIAGRKRVERLFAQKPIWEALEQLYYRFLFLRGYKS